MTDTAAEANARLPRDQIEQIVSDACAQLLGLEVVDLSNSFFDLGGDSLKAIMIQISVEETFEVDLSLSLLFEHPTIASLSTLIDG